MNLYLFNDNDIASTYGIGTYLTELAQALKDSTIRIHIVHLHSVRPEFEIVKTNEIENWYIPEVRNNNTFAGDIQKMEDYYRNVIYLLRLYIKDKKKLIFHFNYNQCYALVKGLKFVFNCRTVVTIHFMKWAFEFQGNIKKLYALKSKSENQMNSFEQLLYTTNEYESLLYNETDYVIALSHYMKNLLYCEYKIGLNKISVIPNGLRDTNNLKVKDKEDVRRKWRISRNESLILFAGRLQPIKGIDFLIRAFQKVLVTIQDCRLLIAGSGQYNIYIQEAKDVCTKVTFTGLLKKKELYELYQIADVGVMPSLYEPFGYVAVEMMMYELPIVSTATSGLNEVINETSGLKIPIIDYSDRLEIDTELLAEKIIYLLQNPDKAKRQGDNARKLYKEKYSSEIFRTNMLAFYESLYKD